MRLKHAVDVRSVKPELMLALFVADGVWKARGQELVVTEIFALGGHSTTSLHYDGRAADLRTRYFHDSEVPAVAAALREALGNSEDFDIVVHKTHIHIEYQPKRRG